MWWFRIHLSSNNASLNIAIQLLIMKVFSLQKVNSYIQKRRDGVETMDNLEEK